MATALVPITTGPAGAVPSLVRLPNATVGSLSGPNVTPLGMDQSSAPTTLTVTLRRSSQSDFEQYLSNVQKPSSPSYHHFLTQSELTETFGPSDSAYNSVLSWLTSNGFSLVEGSADRLTITVRGSQKTVDSALHVTTERYSVQGRDVYANSDAPAVPAGIAADIQSISGLDDVAQPQAPQTTIQNYLNTISPCLGDVLSIFLPNAEPLALGVGLAFVTLLFPEMLLLIELLTVLEAGANIGANYANFSQYFNCIRTYHAPANGGGSSGFGGGGGGSLTSFSPALASTVHLASAPADPAEKIGLLEYDTYHESDVSDWVNLTQSNTAGLSDLSEVPVNGGVASPGAGEDEVLLDIDTILDLENNTSPPQVVVYDAPPSTSFEQMFNTMIGDGDTVISNSWSECEDEVSQADAQGIDSVLAEAAASGVSVFNGSGDDGSSCSTGAPIPLGYPKIHRMPPPSAGRHPHLDQV